jgi:hypothetical protein
MLDLFDILHVVEFVRQFYPCPDCKPHPGKCRRCGGEGKIHGAFRMSGVQQLCPTCYGSGICSRCFDDKDRNGPYIQTLFVSQEPEAPKAAVPPTPPCQNSPSE